MNAPLSPKQIEIWPLARLKPYARNAKTHDADQVAKIAASMAEFGWTVPVLVAADGELIAGHGRILAAAHLGLTEAPVIILGHLTEAQRRAYRIADNKLTELGGWDEALLLQELQALLAEDFDLGLIGIPEDELDALLANADDRPAISDDAADAIPAPPAEPITRPGDIWALGKHRLCCGDATDPAAVARLMQGEQATLMFTSPPYAQQRDYGAAKEKVGDWDALMQGVFAVAPVTADAQLLINLGLVHRDSEWQPYWEGWVEWMRGSGWRRFGWYVWDQGPGLPGDWNGRLAPSHEFIFHFNRAPRNPDLTVSEWADEHRWLSSRGAAEPGRYRTARAPYLREIMDALSPRHPAQRISFMKAAQVGATEAGNNWIGFVIHHAPGPMLAVLPSLELAKRTSRGRLDPLIAESPALRERVNPARSRDAGNSMLSKEFPGGILVLTGANSATGLRSMPARYIFLDEVDAYPASADEEGDPVTLAEARTTTFSHRRKVFMVSTPTIRGLSRIEREFDASDQRRYFVPCPHCGAMQWLQFERLRWDKGRPDTAAYHCEGCEKPIAEHHKTQMLEKGEWRATAVSADPHSIGFHISALYSPLGWKSWQQIARDWLAAQGSEEMLRAARNTLLGETWVESGDAPEWRRLAERREAYAGAQIPDGGLFLTAGVDVQKDRIEVDVWAWGRGLESWLVDHIVIAGGPDDPACWDKLTALLGRTWTCANGAVMVIGKLAIDTGYEAPAVYAWARKQGFDQVAPIKGLEGFNRATPVSGPTFVDATIGGKRLRRGARLWSVATATFKTETYRYLRLERPSDEDRALGVLDAPGTVHLPDWIDTEWLKQLVAEQLVTVRNKRGYAHPEWQKMRERNEALDCRVYARAAAWIMGADRWDEATWRWLEVQAGVETRSAHQTSAVAEPTAPSPPKAGTPTTPRRKRRAYTPNFMRD